MRRRHLTPVTAGLSAACALLLLAGCGSDDSTDATGSSAPATSSSAAASSSTVADADPFCTQAVDAGNDLNDLFTSAGDDLTQLPTLLTQAADRFAQIQAPDAVSADWATLTDGLGQLADSAQGVDFNDQTQVTAFEQSVAALEAPLTTAQTNVSTYLESECGVDPDTGETAAPTS